MFRRFWVYALRRPVLRQCKVQGRSGLAGERLEGVRGLALEFAYTCA